mmetsp:Transcript_88133/g.227286  ORF Transcript_88133/g.227286 Transcript_88133/m.227286 type:complete len:250 (-) Transcript_88133:9-758(-)
MSAWAAVAWPWNSSFTVRPWLLPAASTNLLLIALPSFVALVVFDTRKTSGSGSAWGCSCWKTRILSLRSRRRIWTSAEALKLSGIRAMAYMGMCFTRGSTSTRSTARSPVLKTATMAPIKAFGDVLFEMKSSWKSGCGAAGASAAGASVASATATSPSSARRATPRCLTLWVRPTHGATQAAVVTEEAASSTCEAARTAARAPSNSASTRAARPLFIAARRTSRPGLAAPPCSSSAPVAMVSLRGARQV